MSVFQNLFMPPEQPDNITSARGRVAFWLMWHKYLLNLGRGQVLGTITSTFSEVAMLLLVLDKVGYGSISLTTMVIVSVLATVVVWFTGWLFMYWRMDIHQALVCRQRDIMFREVHDKVCKGGDNK
jgi:hypothetical protein